MTDDAAPGSAYRRGWRDALEAAGKCGAYNAAAPPPEYALCVRERGHGGLHDDMWRAWGDRNAAGPANQRDAARHYGAERQAAMKGGEG